MNLKPIVFIDTEIEPKSGKILDIGGIKGVGSLQINGWLRQVSLWVGICLHKLLKDDKLQTEDTNNPINDSIKAKDLFFDEIAARTYRQKYLTRLVWVHHCSGAKMKFIQKTEVQIILQIALLLCPW